MANAKRTQKQDLSLRQRRLIWTKATPEDWRAFLSLEAPANRWSLKGRSLNGLCPKHSEKSKSFHIFLDKKYAKCYGCQYYETDPIKFIQLLLNLSPTQALEKIREKVTLPEFNAEYLHQLEEAERLRVVKEHILAFSKRELTAAINSRCKGSYEYALPLVEYLQKRLTLKYLHIYPIGIFPSREAFQNHFLEMFSDTEKEGAVLILKGALEYLEPYFTGNNVGEMLIAYHLAPNCIGRFKVRCVGEKIFTTLADPIETELGFFGLSCYSSLIGQSTGATAVIVEGEFDQLSLLEHQAEANMDCLILATSGAGGPKNLDVLASLGVNHAILLGDNDAGGQTWGRTMIAQTKELSIKVASWPAEAVPGDDPDEFVKKSRNGFNSLWTHIHSPKNQSPPHLQMFHWAREKLAQIEEEDIRAKIDCAVGFAKDLPNDSERNAFAGTLQDVFNLSKADILLKSIPDSEGEEAFVIRLVETLRTKYHIIGQLLDGPNPNLVLFSKAKRQVRKLPIAKRNDAEVILSADLGQLTEWVKNEVGEPGFLKYSKAYSPDAPPIPNSIPRKSNLIKDYMGQAFQHMMIKAPAMSSLTPLGQGIHWLNESGEQVVYVVNGQGLYKGQKSPTGQVIWTTPEGPSTSNNIFTLQTSEEWTTSIQNVRDLESIPDAVDPVELYNSIRLYHDIGWKFQEHELECTFLSALMMSRPIMDLFPRQVLVHFNADYHTGKSSYVMGALCGTQFKHLRLLEPSFGADNYTVASVSQKMQGRRQVLCLDESEKDGDRDRVNNMQQMLMLCRNVINGESISMRGTSDGSVREVSLRFSLYFASIKAPHELADISRIISIKLIKSDEAKDPKHFLPLHFGPTGIHELKHKLTKWALPRIYDLHKTYVEIEQEFGGGQGLPSGVMSRFRESLYPAAMVLKYLGQDYQKFMFDYCQKKGHVMKGFSGAPEHEHLLECILNTAVISARSENSLNIFLSVRTFLEDPTKRFLLKEAAIGVTYYTCRGKSYIAINWSQVLPGVLKLTRYGRETPPALSAILSKNPTAVPIPELENDATLKDATLEAAGRLVGLRALTVLDVTELLASADAASARISAPTTAVDRDIPIQQPNF